MNPRKIPQLKFDANDQTMAYETLGANCGPGAIAGLCGTTPYLVASLMPEFAKRQSTTEVMLTQTLDILKVKWKRVSPPDVTYGILRVQWDGPWMFDQDPYEKFRHTHWVGIRSLNGNTDIFDINAISLGGWISYLEWSTKLVPWLIESYEPEANDHWSFSDGYELLEIH